MKKWTSLKNTTLSDKALQRTVLRLLRSGNRQNHPHSVMDAQRLQVTNRSQGGIADTATRASAETGDPGGWPPSCVEEEQESVTPLICVFSLRYFSF
jgi:hypothetical protein